MDSNFVCETRFKHSIYLQSITADEGIANGVGEFRFDWVMLPGTESGNLARDSFYVEMMDAIPSKLKLSMSMEKLTRRFKFKD